MRFQMLLQLNYWIFMLHQESERFDELKIFYPKSFVCSFTLIKNQPIKIVILRIKSNSSRKWLNLTLK